MVKLPKRFTLLAVFACTASLLPAADVELKSVAVDEFFGGQLEHLPLKLQVPKAYLRARDLKVEQTYSYWMLPADIKTATSTGSLPGKNGYLYGKLSLDVGYSKTEKKFSHEDTFKKEAKAAGFDVVSSRKHDAGGFPAIASILAAKGENGNPRRLLFTGYVATMIESNCIFLSWTAPAALTEGEATKAWNAIIDSIERNDTPTKPLQPKPATAKPEAVKPAPKK